MEDFGGHLLVYCAPFVFLEADRDHQSCENYCGVEMTLTDLCKGVLELDEKATDGRVSHTQELIKKGLHGHLTLEDSKAGGVLELISNYRTSAPLLAKACLRMKEALEFYAETPNTVHHNLYEIDCGAKARKALEEMK
jgi:hypothetical protein